MKKILAFSGSNYSKSTNKQLLNFTAALINEYEVEVLDISKWDIPIYSIDMDPDQTPDEITRLIKLIQEHDAIILSSPEHNGGTPAFLKNIIDWLSRRSKQVFNSKPMLLMSTSPGPSGGANNLRYLEQSLPYQGVNIAATFSLPSFFENLTNGKMNENLQDELQIALNKLMESMKS